MIGKEYRVLMLGLEASGKTTLLYRLKLDEIVTTIPTIGFNVETIPCQNTNITVWDVGGQDKIQPLWRHYYENTQGLIYVIDCNDKDRIEEAQQVLFKVLTDESMQKIPVLILANKSDLPYAMTQEEVETKMKVNEIKGRDVAVRFVSAIASINVVESFEWLAQAMGIDQVSAPPSGVYDHQESKPLGASEQNFSPVAPQNPTTNYKVLMFGIDGAGKTTMLYKLKLGEVISCIPTMGFNCETIAYKDCNLEMVDISGQEKLRTLWKHYISDAKAVIYVVDSFNIDRLDEATHCLDEVLSWEELKQTPLLVYCNKADIQKVSVMEICEKLNLHKLSNKQWYIQACSTITGDGLYEGLDWLATSLKNN